MSRQFFLFLLLAGLMLTGCRHISRIARDDSLPPQKGDLVIHRDTWGVPHVFGKTNSDAAFGLAYAISEDDFTTIQDLLLATRAKTAFYKGKDSAPIDYFVKFFDFPGLGEKYYPAMDDEIRSVIDGYVRGLNYYASLHPKEVNYNIFPIRGEDIIAGYMMSVSSFIRIPSRLREVLGSERRRKVSEAQPQKEIAEEEVKGSNAFAFSPARTADGSTILVANTHQPWTGPQAWYEAHVKSEEGWNVAGGFFPGAPVPTVGFNEHLGWTHTVNRPDLEDIYVLEMHPTDPLKYRFDGEWLTLEERTIKLKVKLRGFLRVTVKRKVYRSVHGPVVKTDHGVYAIRYAGYDMAGALDQWLHMGLAKNKAEWDTAMARHELPMFNSIYADREGNISYVYNAALPLRNPAYNWSLYLPGDTSATLWTNYLPYDKLPSVTNPLSGFVQNCNATPFTTTVGQGNPDPDVFPRSMGIERHATNRELRAMELFGTDESLTLDEILRYKYDMQYSEQSAVAREIRELKQAELPQDSLMKAALDVLFRWDLNTDPENEQAALGVLTFHGRLTKQLIRNASRNPSMEDVLASLRASAEFMMKHHGRLEIPWKEVNRLRRGDVDIGMGGGPDVLHAMYGRIEEDGTATGIAGDSHIIVVKWNADGSMETQSVHPFGSTTSHPESPHYADQSPLFAERRLKKLWFTEEEILANIEQSYYPGEER